MNKEDVDVSKVQFIRNGKFPTVDTLPPGEMAFGLIEDNGEQLIGLFCNPMTEGKGEIVCLSLLSKVPPDPQVLNSENTCDSACSCHT